MEFTYIYPGTFCPPTFGHLHVATQAAQVFGSLIIICSENQNKQDNIFSARQRCSLWKKYHLPKNTSVMTLDEFRQSRPNPSQIVMIRGIRNGSDYTYEGDVIAQNKKTFGIDKYFFFLSPPEYEGISSGNARKVALQGEFEELQKYVCPGVASATLEKMLGLQNLFLVVGKPGSGKTTFLKMLNETNKDIGYINADRITKSLLPDIQKMFPKEDLLSLVKNDEQKILDAMRHPWMQKLKEELLSLCKASHHIFLEIPFAFQENKKLWQCFGGKTIYVGCKDNEGRLVSRGTPNQKLFIERIPDLTQTQKICQDNNLELTTIELNGTLDDTRREAANFAKRLESEEP